MFGNQLTDAVKHLLIINVIMYFGTMFLMGDPSNMALNALVNETGGTMSWGRFQLAVFYPSSPYFSPYQIVTHMFMHADMGHLFFNMFALFIFGPHLESLWGSEKFTLLYFVSGFGALVLHMFSKYVEINYLGGSPMLANIPTLGASGAVFGILAGFAMKFPNVKLFLLFLPVPIRAKYFVLIYAGIELFLGLSPTFGSSGVAHFAHVGGALFGFLLVLYWNRQERRR